MNILVDTSILIDHIRQSDNRTLFNSIAKHHQMYISLVTHTELYSGKSVWESYEVLQEVENLLAGLEIVLVTTTISKLAGKIRATNNGIGLPDSIIAGTAIRSALPLATLNTKHFKDIKGLKLFDLSSLDQN